MVSMKNYINLAAISADTLLKTVTWDDIRLATRNNSNMTQSINVIDNIDFVPITETFRTTSRYTINTASYYQQLIV